MHVTVERVERSMALPAGARWGKAVEPVDAGAGSAISLAKAAFSEVDAAKKDMKKVVLDSGAIIKGRRLESLGDAFWTVRASKHG